MSTKPITVTFERAEKPLLSGTRPYLARLSEHNDAVATILRLCGFEYQPIGLCWTTLTQNDFSAAEGMLRSRSACHIAIAPEIFNFRWSVESATQHITLRAENRALEELKDAVFAIYDHGKRIENERAGRKKHPQEIIFSPPDGDVFS